VHKTASLQLRHWPRWMEAATRIRLPVGVGFILPSNTFKQFFYSFSFFSELQTVCWHFQSGEGNNIIKEVHVVYAIHTIVPQLTSGSRLRDTLSIPLTAQKQRFSDTFPLACLLVIT